VGDVHAGDALERGFGKKATEQAALATTEIEHRGGAGTQEFLDDGFETQFVEGGGLAFFGGAS
jgi:hypothetical protein